MKGAVMPPTPSLTSLPSWQCRGFPAWAGRNLLFRRDYHDHLVARISWADVWGRVGVEDRPSFREREFAVVDHDYRRPVNPRGRRIRLSSPSWEDATPSIVLLGCP